MLTDQEKALFLPTAGAAKGKTIREFHDIMDGVLVIEFTDGTVLYMRPATDRYDGPYIQRGGIGDYHYAVLHTIGKITDEEWEQRCDEDARAEEQSRQERDRTEYERLKRKFEPQYGPHPDPLTNLSGIPQC